MIYPMSFSRQINLTETSFMRSPFVRASLIDLPSLQ